MVMCNRVIRLVLVKDLNFIACAPDSIEFPAAIGRRRRLLIFGRFQAVLAWAPLDVTWGKARMLPRKRSKRP